MKLLNRVVVCSITILFFLLSGCHAPIYNKTENNIADVKERITSAVKNEGALAKGQPALVVKQGLYVDKTPVNLAREPSWLKNRIVLQGDDLPFSYYSRTIGGGGGPHVLTRYQTGLNASTKLSMSYSGTVKGALDLLATKMGYTYTINGNDVYWQAFLTRTYDVAFLPGTADYMMGKASGATSGAVAQGGTNSTSATGFLDDSSGSQYSSLGGKISVWDDVRNTIKQMLSPDGTVIVSQATTSVTVRDRISNLDIVGQYIQNMNKNLSAQVLVKIQVLEIILNDDFNYGINWNIVQNALGGTKYALQANYGTPVAITALTGASVLPTIGFPSPDATGVGVAGTWFSAVVSALQQQGRVSVVSEPRVVCMNNQVSSVRLVNQEGYLASIQISSFGGTGTTTAGANANQVTSQITPGTLITGLTLYILPKVMGDKVYLQVNADLSNNQGFKNISSSADTSAAGAQVIQVPTVAQKQFNQRSMIASGDTLILSGFRRVANRTGAMQLFGSQSLGGKASTQNNAETIVLITPIILHGVV
jgi:MSHA biogenesis protein MshL